MAKKTKRTPVFLGKLLEHFGCDPGSLPVIERMFAMPPLRGSHSHRMTRNRRMVVLRGFHFPPGGSGAMIRS